MSEKNKHIISIETGKPLSDYEVHEAEAMAIAVDQPEAEQHQVEVKKIDANALQGILRKAGGEQRNGDTLQDVRKRGAKRIGAGIVAGVAAIGIANQGVDMARDYISDRVSESDQANVTLMEDYKEDMSLDDGKVVLKFNEPGVAWDAAGEVSSGEGRSELVDQIQAQTDVQLDPGINPGDIAVVDAELVDPNSPLIIDVGPNKPQ